MATIVNIVGLLANKNSEQWVQRAKDKYNRRRDTYEGVSAAFQSSAYVLSVCYRVAAAAGIPGAGPQEHCARGGREPHE